MSTSTVTTATPLSTTGTLREIALRVSLPVVCVWFGLVSGALHGATTWASAVLTASFVTAVLVLSAMRRVARGERRYPRA